MATEPIISVSLRLPRAVHDLLKEVAAQERRSMTKMVEVLIVRYGKDNGIGLSAKRPGTKRNAR